MDRPTADPLPTIAEIVHEVTGAEVERVRPDATLADLDMDSLSAVEVVIGIEQRLGVRIPDAEVASLQTVGDLQGAVQRASG